MGQRLAILTKMEMNTRSKSRLTRLPQRHSDRERPLSIRGDYLVEPVPNSAGGGPPQPPKKHCCSCSKSDLLNTSETSFKGCAYYCGFNKYGSPSFGECSNCKWIVEVSQIPPFHCYARCEDKYKRDKKQCDSTTKKGTRARKSCYGVIGWTASLCYRSCNQRAQTGHWECK